MKVTGCLFAVFMALCIPANAQVNGENVEQVRFMGERSYKALGQGIWEEMDEGGEVLSTWIERSRDAWSVYLDREDLEGDLQFDLWKKTIRRVEPIQEAAAEPVEAESIEVNGENVSYVSYYGGAAFVQQDDGTWHEVKPDGSHDFTFKERGRDAWSVYLYDGSRSVSIQLDLWKKDIIYSDANGARFVLSKISEARAGNAGEETPKEVTGENATRVALEGDVLFVQHEDGTWHEEGEGSEVIGVFDETGRDAWSIYLKGQQDEGQVQIDLWKKTVQRTVAIGEAFAAEAAPMLAVEPDALALVGTVPTGELTLSNEGGGALTFTVSASVPWLQLEPETGEIEAGNPILVELNVDEGIAPPGQHEIYVEVSSPERAVQVPVQVEIEAPPELVITPEQISFVEPSELHQLLVSNGGGGSLEFILSSSVPWLMLSEEGGTVSQSAVQVELKVDTDMVPPGQHEVYVEIAAGEQIVRVPVRVSIEAAPVLHVDPISLDFGVRATNGSLTVYNEGGGTLVWDATEMPQWLTVAPSSGEVSEDEWAEIEVRVNRSLLEEGLVEDVLHFSSNGGDTEVSVEIETTGERTPITGFTKPATYKTGGDPCLRRFEQIEEVLWRETDQNGCSEGSGGVYYQAEFWEEIERTSTGLTLQKYREEPKDQLVVDIAGGKVNHPDESDSRALDLMDVTEGDLGGVVELPPLRGGLYQWEQSNEPPQNAVTAPVATDEGIYPAVCSGIIRDDEIPLGKSRQLVGQWDGESCIATHEYYNFEQRKTVKTVHVLSNEQLEEVAPVDGGYRRTTYDGLHFLVEAEGRALWFRDESFMGIDDGMRGTIPPSFEMKEEAVPAPIWKGTSYSICARGTQVGYYSNSHHSNYPCVTADPDPLYLPAVLVGQVESAPALFRTELLDELPVEDTTVSGFSLQHNGECTLLFEQIEPTLWRRSKTDGCTGVMAYVADFWEETERVGNIIMLRKDNRDLYYRTYRVDVIFSSAAMMENSDRSLGTDSITDLVQDSFEGQGVELAAMGGGQYRWEWDDTPPVNAVRAPAVDELSMEGAVCRGILAEEENLYREGVGLKDVDGKYIDVDGEYVQELPTYVGYWNGSDCVASLWFPYKNAYEPRLLKNEKVEQMTISHRGEHRLWTYEGLSFLTLVSGDAHWYRGPQFGAYDHDGNAAGSIIYGPDPIEGVVPASGMKGSHYICGRGGAAGYYDDSQIDLSISHGARCMTDPRDPLYLPAVLIGEVEDSQPLVWSEPIEAPDYTSGDLSKVTSVVAIDQEYRSTFGADCTTRLEQIDRTVWQKTYDGCEEYWRRSGDSGRDFYSRPHFYLETDRNAQAVYLEGTTTTEQKVVIDLWKKRLVDGEDGRAMGEITEVEEETFAAVAEVTPPQDGWRYGWARGQLPPDDAVTAPLSGRAICRGMYASGSDFGGEGILVGHWEDGACRAVSPQGNSVDLRAAERQFLVKLDGEQSWYIGPDFLSRGSSLESEMINVPMDQVISTGMMYPYEGFVCAQSGAAGWGAGYRCMTADAEPGLPQVLLGQLVDAPPLMPAVTDAIDERSTYFWRKVSQLPTDNEDGTPVRAPGFAGVSEIVCRAPIAESRDESGYMRGMPIDYNAPWRSYSTGEVPLDENPAAYWVGTYRGGRGCVLKNAPSGAGGWNEEDIPLSSKQVELLFVSAGGQPLWATGANKSVASDVGDLIVPAIAFDERAICSNSGVVGQIVDGVCIADSDVVPDPRFMNYRNTTVLAGSLVADPAGAPMPTLTSFECVSPTTLNDLRCRVTSVGTSPQQTTYRWSARLAPGTIAYTAPTPAGFKEARISSQSDQPNVIRLSLSPDSDQFTLVTDEPQLSVSSRDFQYYIAEDLEVDITLEVCAQECAPPITGQIQVTTKPWLVSMMCTPFVDMSVAEPGSITCGTPDIYFKGSRQWTGHNEKYFDLTWAWPTDDNGGAAIVNGAQVKPWFGLGNGSRPVLLKGSLKEDMADLLGVDQDAMSRFAFAGADTVKRSGGVFIVTPFGNIDLAPAQADAINKSWGVTANGWQDLFDVVGRASSYNLEDEDTGLFDPTN